MGWPILAATGISVVAGLFGAKQAGDAASDARSDQNRYNEQSLAAQQEANAFAREQYDRWNEVYGPIEENLSNFYSNLTPEQVSSAGLQRNQQAFQSTVENLQRNVAQRGIDSPAATAMESSLELENARNKAQIRADAPLQVAQAKQGFLSSGKGNPNAAGVTNQLGNTAGLYGQQAAVAGQQAGAYNRQVNQAYTNVGSAIGSAASLYAKNQQLQTQQPQSSGNNIYGTYNYTPDNFVERRS